MNAKRKRNHHYLSAFLLRHFEEDHQFTVVPLNGSPAHIGTSSSVGWLKDSHRADPLETDPNAYEDAQSKHVENRAAPLVQRLIAGDCSLLEGPEREVLEKLLILHHQRHPAMMEQVSRAVAPEFQRFEGIPGMEGVRRALLAQAVTFTADLDAKFIPEIRREVEARWAQYRGVFDAFTWNLVTFPEPSLVLGDMLVCPSRLARTRRADERQYGNGVGLQTAERVTVALSPTTGLLLSRGDRVRRLVPEAFNRSTIGSATSYVIFPRSWPSRNPVVFKSAADLLQRRGAAPLVGHRK
ncbi:DUF4238 domain-containing protein [Clavibacter michiganensis]|uniref:DUF4238 domain-containing protein n=1 Tax=Clavibacter michiganensis TaxID=28447 RepID=UPI00374E0A1D